MWWNGSWNRTSFNSSLNLFWIWLILCATSWFLVHSKREKCESKRCRKQRSAWTKIRMKWRNIHVLYSISIMRSQTWLILYLRKMWYLQHFCKSQISYQNWCIISGTSMNDVNSWFPLSRYSGSDLNILCFFFVWVHKGNCSDLH